MNEYERREILKKLKEIKKIFTERNNTIEEKEKLKQNETVQRYFSLQRKIADLNEQIINLNKYDKFNRNFEQIVINEFKDKENHFSKCEHPIYVYIGSFKDEGEYGYESRVYSHRVDNEKSFDFEYNIYKCLVCGSTKIIYKNKYPNYEEFEKEHNVLKSYLMNPALFDKLQEEYYKYLYNHTVETTQKKLIKVFKERYN